MNRQRMLIIILIASITINLLFVGALIGRWALGNRSHGFPPHFGWLVRTLDDETRAALRPVIRQQAEQLRPLRQEMRQAQLRFNRALTSEPLDEAALDEALVDVRETSEAFQAAMHKQVLAVIKRMDAQERREVARVLRRHGPHRPPGDRGPER